MAQKEKEVSIALDEKERENGKYNDYSELLYHMESAVNARTRACQIIDGSRVRNWIAATSFAQNAEFFSDSSGFHWMIPWDSLECIYWPDQYNKKRMSS